MNEYYNKYINPTSAGSYGDDASNLTPEELAKRNPSFFNQASSVFDLGQGLYNTGKAWGHLTPEQKIIAAGGNVSQGLNTAQSLGITDTGTLSQGLGGTLGVVSGIKNHDPVAAGIGGLNLAGSLLPNTATAATAPIAVDAAGDAVIGQVASTGADAAGTVAGSTAAGTLGALAGGAGAIYGLKKTSDYAASAPSGGQRNSISTLSGAAAGAAGGAAIGSVVPIVGTAIGGVLGGITGGLYGLTSSLTGSHKDKYQMMRDMGRRNLQEGKILDENYQGTLADNSKFDFGKDGKQQTELDYNDPVTGRAIGKANLIAASEGYTGKQREAMAKLYTAAMMSNANGDEKIIADNARHFLDQRGLDATKTSDILKQELANKQISQEEYDAFNAERQNTLAPAPVANVQRSQARPTQVRRAEPKPKQKAPSLYDIMPKPVMPPVMPEPDNAPSSKELLAAQKYQDAFQSLYQRRK